MLLTDILDFVTTGLAYRFDAHCKLNKNRTYSTLGCV